jgi:hypothetical protein
VENVDVGTADAGAADFHQYLVRSRKDGLVVAQHQTMRHVYGDREHPIVS